MHYYKVFPIQITNSVKHLKICYNISLHKCRNISFTNESNFMCILDFRTFRANYKRLEDLRFILRLNRVEYHPQLIKTTKNVVLT